MKKVSKFGALAILAFAMLFTVASCSDDDDDDAPAVPTLTPLEEAKATYTEKVAELNAAKATKLASVTTVVYGTVTEADKFEVPFDGKYIKKEDVATYTTALSKTADEVVNAVTASDGGDDDTATPTDEDKIEALNDATTALEDAKTAFENAIITLDEKWNADHFWSNNGASTIDQITGENGNKKVANTADGLKEPNAKTSKEVTLKWLGYADTDIASTTNPTEIVDKNVSKTGYNVGVAEYDNRHGYINFYKTRSATGFVTEFDSDGKVTRIKIVQTINDAIANVGNHLKSTEVSWYKTAVGNYGTGDADKSWAASDDFEGAESDITENTMQYNVGIRLGGITENAAGKKTEAQSCTGITTSDKGTDNKIKFVRLADNSGKSVTKDIGSGNTVGGRNQSTCKTYTTSTNAYDETYVPFFDYGTKIPIVAGKKSVYKVTLQKDAGTQDANGVEQGTGLIMDFVVNINAAAEQPFADYQFRE